MGLFSIIDLLLLGTHYLAWGIAVIGVPMSLVLVFANLSLGIPSAVIFFASFFLAAGIAVILMPKKVSERIPVAGKLFAPAVAACVIGLVLGAAVFFLNGGFPEVNLLFA